MRCITLLTLATLAGCAGLPSPALSGKTNYSVKFIDQTADQNTQYEMNIKAPAGVELDSITGMTYDWSPDGSGSINVSNDGSVDSSGQAQLIQQITEKQIEALNMMLNALAPVVGQALQSRDNQAVVEATSKDAQLDKILKLIEGLSRED